MSLRRAARVFACVAIASFALAPVLRADEAITVDHAPDVLTKVYQVADLIVPLASNERPKRPDFDWLMDLIELRTGADCWTHSGGHGVISAHESTQSLVVRQTQATHERIADLLNEIRGTGDLALAVEIQLVRGNLEACGDTQPHRTAQGLVDAGGKQRLLQFLQSQTDGQVLAAPKITFFNGTTASVETTDAGCTKSFHLRGVISKDNRYARLWVDAKVDGQSTKAELLIPEGHTAVRKLPGEDTWLLLTSHVINAEEPQVIGPIRPEPSTPVEQKKRYLVPVDDSPEPTELTSVPHFKAQAEGFGLAVQRIKGVLETAAETIGASEPQPALANPVERVEYQVAQAEPAEPSVDSKEPPPPPKAVSYFERHPLQEPLPRRPRSINLSGNRFVFRDEKQDADKEAPFRLWIGDMLAESGFAQDDRCVVNTVTVEPTAVDPPARLDVCLDDADCQTAPWAPVQLESPAFHGIFVAPMPTSPTRWQESPGQRSRGSITLDHWKSQAPVSISQVEVGRGAILTQPKSREVSGFILHCEPAPVAGTPHIGFNGNELVFISPRHSSRVQQVSGVEASIVTLDSHLKAAESTLDKLGLDAEEETIRSMRQKIRQRAEERCQEIDREIMRLKVARERLEKIAKPAVTGGAIDALEGR